MAAQVPARHSRRPERTSEKHSRSPPESDPTRTRRGSRGCASRRIALRDWRLGRGDTSTGRKLPARIRRWRSGLLGRQVRGRSADQGGTGRSRVGSRSTHRRHRGRRTTCGCRALPPGSTTSAIRLGIEIPQAVAAGLRSPRTIPRDNGIATMTAELDEDSGVRLLSASDSADDRAQACRRARRTGRGNRRRA